MPNASPLSTNRSLSSTTPGVLISCWPSNFVKLQLQATPVTQHHTTFQRASNIISSFLSHLSARGAFNSTNLPLFGTKFDNCQKKKKKWIHYLCMTPYQRICNWSVTRWVLGNLNNNYNTKRNEKKRPGSLIYSPTMNSQQLYTSSYRK